MFSKIIAAAEVPVIATATDYSSSTPPMGGELITTILMMVFYAVVAAGFIGMIVFGVKMLSKKTDGEALNKARKGFKTSLLVFIVPLLIVIVGILFMKNK